MTPSMTLVANQILACPYHGMTKKMYYEGKSLELMALQLTQLANKGCGNVDHPLLTKLNANEFEQPERFFWMIWKIRLPFCNLPAWLG